MQSIIIYKYKWYKNKYIEIHYSIYIQRQLYYLLIILNVAISNFSKFSNYMVPFHVPNMKICGKDDNTVCDILKAGNA